MTQPFIDTGEFTRLGKQLRGRVGLRDLSRLASGLPDQGGAQAQWAVHGLQDSAGQAWLEIAVQAAPLVQCQRCLQPMAWPVDARNRLLVVDSEAGLGREDDPQLDPDDWIEPVLASNRLDVLALVEDELILALPYVPMHPQCASPASRKAADGGPEEEASPFDVLRQLKKN